MYFSRAQRTIEHNAASQHSAKNCQYVLVDRSNEVVRLYAGAWYLVHGYAVAGGS